MNEKMKPWLNLSYPLAILVSIASAMGIFSPDIYALDAKAYAIQGIGQDIATLFIIVPTLIITAIKARKGSTRSLLIHLGALAYVFYSYSMYAITVHFNALFLVYCLSMGLSFYALVGILSNLDPKPLKTRITSLPKEKTIRRSLAIFLFFTATMFYFLWLSDVIPNLLAGTTPASLIEIGLPSNMVHVYDLAIVLPAFILSGIWLLRKNNYGFVIAPILIVFGIFMACALVSMAVYMFINNLTTDISPAIIFSFLAILNVIFAAIYLRAMPKN